jgi:hypothetical protein
VRRAALFAMLSFAAGCGTADDRPAAWGYISPAIFQPACATSSCHSRGVAQSGVDFSDPDRGYESLTASWFIDPMGTADDGCEAWKETKVCPGKPFVIAYDPGQSRLVSMLRARGASRMPPDRPLPEVDIRLVESWILDGARKTVDGPPAPTARRDGGTIVEAGTGDSGMNDAGVNDASPDVIDGPSAANPDAHDGPSDATPDGGGGT